MSHGARFCLIVCKSVKLVSEAVMLFYIPNRKSGVPVFPNPQSSFKHAIVLNLVLIYMSMICMHAANLYIKRCSTSIDNQKNAEHFNFGKIQLTIFLSLLVFFCTVKENFSYTEILSRWGYLDYFYFGDIISRTAVNISTWL